jgi:hypothetical protein
MGAKVGANSHRREATPGDVQRTLPQLEATLSDEDRRQAARRG